MGRWREFNFRPVEVGGVMKTGVALHCATPGCHTTLSLHVNTSKGYRDGERDSKIVVNKFERSHWTVGRTPAGDYCNACTAARSRNGMSASLADATNGAVMKATVTRIGTSGASCAITGTGAGSATAASAGASTFGGAGGSPAADPPNAPRAMTIDDALLIAGKLAEVYQDAKKGYAAPWNDQKVAEDLNVPRGWVAEVRRKQYGQEASGGNEEIRAAIEEAGTLLADAKSVAVSAAHLASKASQVSADVATLNETLKKLAVRAEKIERTLVEIRGALK